jgi:tetratricopeptide (TPR) repeat protein
MRGDSAAALSWWPFFAFIGFTYLNIYIHEFGHALAGMAVKFPIKRITIGTGREVMRTQIRGTVLIITNGFNGGYTNIGSVSQQALKFRFLFFVLGGIGIQGLAIVLTILLFDIRLYNPGSIPTFSTIASMFMYSNLFLILLNLFPRKFNLGGIKIPNDGLRLVKLPFLKPHDIQEILAAGKILEAHELYETKKFHEAELGFRECIERYPAPLLPKLNLSAALIKQLKFDETITFLESLRDTYDHDPYAFFLYNNLAWAHFLQCDEDALRKADGYSYRAFELNPKHRHIIGTRGCVLIERGAVDEGIALLMKNVHLRKLLDEKTNNPVNFMYLAYGYYLKGDMKRALQYINKLETSGVSLDQDYHLLFEHIIKKTGNFTRPIHKNNSVAYHIDTRTQAKPASLLTSSTFILLVVLTVITLMILLYIASD